MVDCQRLDLRQGTSRNKFCTSVFFNFRIGPVTTKFFMSDDASQYWNAWISAFGDCGPHPTKLLCSWHVKRNWKLQGNCKLPAEHREGVKKRLNELMAAESETKFRILLTSFFETLREWKCDDFLKYFRSYYCGNPFRPLEWALYARRDSVVNTNTHLEAFHERLKYNFFEGKQNRRMDVLLDQLLEVAAKYSREYKLAQESGLPASTYRLRMMIERHKRSSKLRKDVVKPIQGGWLVPSESQSGRFYFVRRRLTDGTNCACSLRCRFCRVCPDIYSCNCLDAVMPTTACKHMHLVHSILYPELAIPQFSDGDQSTTAVQEEYDVSHSHNESQRQEEQLEDAVGPGEQEWAEFGASLATLTEVWKNSPAPDRATVAALNVKVKEMSTLLKLSSTNTAVVPDLSDEAGPANKLIKRQRRY